MDWQNMSVRWMEDGSGCVIRRAGKAPEHGEIAKSQEVHEAVTLDFDKDGNLIEIEILARPMSKEGEESGA